MYYQCLKSSVGDRLVPDQGSVRRDGEESISNKA